MIKTALSVVVFLSVLLSTDKGFAQQNWLVNPLSPTCTTSCWDLGTKQSCKEWSASRGYGEEPDTVVDTCPAEGCDANEQNCIHHPQRFYRKTGSADDWNKQAQNLICSSNSYKKPSADSSDYMCLKERRCCCVLLAGGTPGCGVDLNDAGMTKYFLRNWVLENAPACSAIDPP